MSEVAKKAPLRTALGRADRIQSAALTFAWREAAAHIDAALEVVKEIKGADGNGDASMAQGVITGLNGELSKIEKHLGTVQQARPAEPSAGESMDADHAARVLAAREAKEEVAQ